MSVHIYIEKDFNNNIWGDERMCLQCYFELSMTLEAERFHKLLKKRKYQLCYDDDKHVDNALASKGITVSFHDNPRKKKVKLAVDWNKALCGDEVEDDKISKRLRKLETRIGDYFNSKYGLNDFKLSGMRIVADIDVQHRAKAASYMKVLKKIGKVKGFSLSSDSRFDDGRSFGLEGNSNGIEFTIRDLEHTKGVLRAEVGLTALRTIRNFTKETIALNQIIDLSKNIEETFFKTFVQIIPAGDFHKKNKAVEIIKSEVSDRTMRRKMLRLITLIPEKKSLLLAQKALNYRKIDEVMYEFFSINLSPVTLSKRHEVKYLKNLYDYF
jgi:hypothetical protein